MCGDMANGSMCVCTGHVGVLLTMGYIHVPSLLKLITTITVLDLECNTWLARMYTPLLE